MRELQERKKIKQLLYSKAAIGILGIMLLFFASAIWGVYGKYTETKKNREIALEKLEELKRREEAIKKEIEYLQTEEGVEEEIRKKFGLVKDGEQVIIITDENLHGSDPTDAVSSESFLGNIWKSVLNLF